MIAELDGAYTKFHEATVESEWRSDKVFVRGSYTWSHYYGNFDQDNSTTANDANIFVGSSFIGDGAGRQLWDFRDGDMRGDRRHVVKVYGYYSLKWDAIVGAYAFAQSGQPWEIWSYEPYIALTTNTADTSRYAEAGRVEADRPARAARSEIHAEFPSRRARAAADRRRPVQRLQRPDRLQPATPTPTPASAFGVSRNFFDPRRFQIAARMRF